MGAHAGSTSGKLENMSKGKNPITRTQIAIGHIFDVQ